VNGEKPAIGCAFHAEPFSFLWMIDHGRNTGASPDGRRDGEIMAYSMSPMQGRDRSGFTALLNSIAAMPTKKAPGASSAIVELDPFYFREENLDILTDLFLAASQEGLSNTQFNIVDRETLVDAKLHPDKYPSLAVRVSGFSQKFVLLSPELQDHIIARTKHASL
jgi:formate C-acetyltransferase